jgi:hypothetical protein
VVAKVGIKSKRNLKSHVEENHSNLRSERDILEEVLELTRINSKRMPRRGEVSRQSVHRLLDTLQEMQYRMMKYGDKESMMFMEEMRRPIKDICMEIDSPELYERYMMNDKRLIFKESRVYLDKTDDKADKTDKV